MKAKGVGFFGALTLVFIVLQLTGVIDWSWVWVLGPLWIPAVAVILVFAGLFALTVRADIKRDEARDA